MGGEGDVGGAAGVGDAGGWPPPPARGGGGRDKRRTQRKAKARTVQLNTNAAMDAWLAGDANEESSG